MSNIAVGVVWQITLMATPVFLVIREFVSFAICVGVLMVTSVFLKFNWWNRLEENYGVQRSELRFQRNEGEATSTGIQLSQDNAF
jgi:hypothetical protein